MWEISNKVDWKGTCNLLEKRHHSPNIACPIYQLSLPPQLGLGLLTPPFHTGCLSGLGMHSHVHDVISTINLTFWCVLFKNKFSFIFTLYYVYNVSVRVGVHTWVQCPGSQKYQIPVGLEFQAAVTPWHGCWEPKGNELGSWKNGTCS